MGSIRPLVTITILVVVGAYLYVKINEGPVKARTSENKSLNQPPDGIPPLTTTKGASLATESTAPAWPGTAATSTPAPLSPAPIAATTNPAPGPLTAGAPAPAPTAKDNMPAVPPLPELPELPATANVMSPVTPPSETTPKELPANIPTARYSGEADQKSNAAGSNEALSQPGPSPMNFADPAMPAPLTTSAQQSVTPPITSPAASPAQNPATNIAPQQPAPTGLESTPVPSSPQSSAQNPLRPSPPPASPPTAPPAEVPDRYASAFTSAPTPSIAPPAATPPSQPAAPTFAASWPAIQAALDRRDLKQAHQLLSKWHGNTSLTPAEAERVQTLLSQLAGTVIYSNEHQLEPARPVRPGETLETIAKEYNVPWQLLVKINGIQSTGQLRPGQELKVVRGPFSAVVNLQHSDVTLLVDDRYAGRFPIAIPPGTTLTDGQWVVDQKLSGPTSTASPSAYATTPVPTNRTIVLRNAAPNAAAGAPTLIIASGAAPIGPAASPPALRVSPQDAEELSDILSIGSRVTVRR